MIITSKVIGAVITTIMVLCLIVGGIDAANGQTTSQPVHEARPGEIDRSLIYKAGIVPINLREHGAADNPSWVFNFQAEQSCINTNNRLFAQVRMIAKRIAEDPSRGKQWQGALTTIHSLWCTEFE